MKPEVKIFIVLSIISIVLTGVLGWRSFKIIFTSFQYQFNQDYMDAKIQIQNNSAGDSTLNVALNLYKQIDEFSMKFVVALEAEEGNYTVLVNHSVNFCKFLKQRTAEPILRLIYEDILNQGSFIKMCPVKKGTYSLEEYRLDEEMLPSYIPETSFFIELKLEQKNTFLFKGTLHGKIDKSKGFNNLKMFSLG